MSQGNYAEEFKEHILSEHEAEVSVRELARRYEPSATTIQNWKRQAKAKASESDQVRVKWRSCVAYSVAIRS